MASERQIAANRLNAAKSTGPRSVQGKARSRHNALTHGLTARHLWILPNEDPAAFDTLCESMLSSLAPDGPLDRELVERTASLLWRLRRIPTFEVAVLEWIKQMEGRDNDYDGSSRYRTLDGISDTADTGRYSTARRDVLEIGRAFEAFLNTDLSKKLGRYETDLQRQLALTLKELRAFQANRPNHSKLVDATAQNVAAEPTALSDQEAVTGPVSRVQRTRPAPVDFDDLSEVDTTALPSSITRIRRDG